jgi:hypothetical protein
VPSLGVKRPAERRSAPEINTQQLPITRNPTSDNYEWARNVVTNYLIKKELYVAHALIAAMIIRASVGADLRLVQVGIRCTGRMGPRCLVVAHEEEISSPQVTARVS